MIPSPSTRLLAVIGSPIGHSMSPRIHNVACRHLGLDLVYLAFEPSSARSAIDAMRALGIRGYSVTIPFKGDVIPHLDEIDPVAAKIGSVNTVLNDGGTIKGCTTDGPGAIDALSRSGVTVEGARILLLGTGGAARALAFTFLEAGAERLDLLGIINDEIERLGADLDGNYPGRVGAARIDGGTLNDLAGSTDLIVNATPVGMYPDTEVSPIDPSIIRPDTVVFDIVYNPVETRLMACAAERGAKTVSGLEMFVGQAVRQFELFTGEPAPIEIMRETVREALS